MNRLEKKCFAASTGSHVLLLCLVVFGSAFFISTKEKAPKEYTKMRVVPSKLVDAAFSGGGGDPTVKPSEELQKGAPDAPKSEPPKAEPPKVTPQPEPVAPPPAPVPEPPRTTTKKSPLPLTETKRTPKPDTKSDTSSIIDDLKPTKRNDADKRKAQEKAAAESRERADREWKSQNKQLAKQIGSAVEGLSQGFKKGTVFKAFGTGGEAYQNYDDYVHQTYDDAWLTPDLMTDQDVKVEVRLVIHRSGRIIEARITKRSGNASLDRSVQGALDQVKSLKPFPEGSLDQQRTYTIDFVPKFKKSLG